jgi:small subunit ribosomal protein S17
MAEEEKDEQEVTSASEAPRGEEGEQEAAAETAASASDADATSEAEADAPEDTPEEAALEPEVPAQLAEALTPKERRRQARAAKAAAVPARPSRSPEERYQERADERRRKAEVRRVHRKRAGEKARARRTEAAPPTAAREHVPGVQKTRQGVVVSDKADKTITVRIDTAHRHRRYEKIVRTSRTLHAHDERNDAHVGDTVIVRESRPLSRTKRWRLVEVVERAE